MGNFKNDRKGVEKFIIEEKIKKIDDMTFNEWNFTTFDKDKLNIARLKLLEIKEMLKEVIEEMMKANG